MGISPPRVNDRPFAQLDALYTHIFSSAYGFMNDAIKSIFGIIFLASQQHYYYLEPSPAFLASVLGLKIHEITFLLDDFVSLVALPQDPAQHIRLFHASLFDFLCNQERSGVFALDLPAAHEAVATHFSRLLNVNHFGGHFSLCMSTNLWRHSNRRRHHLSSFAFASQGSQAVKAISIIVKNFDRKIHSYYKEITIGSYQDGICF